MVTEIPFRLIPKLEIKNGYVVKGLMMEGVQRVGDPLTIAKQYYHQGADELILLDTVASLYKRIELPSLISSLLKETFLPICAGGGVSSVEDAELLFRAGADKVCINSYAVEHPEILNSLTNRFGSQSIVSQIDVKNYHGDYMVFTNTGRNLSKYNLLDWLEIVQSRGVGEVLITSIDKDGLSKGIDFELILEVSKACEISIIYGGGVRNSLDMANVFEMNINGCAIASCLHFNEINIESAKIELLRNNFLMRADK